MHRGREGTARLFTRPHEAVEITGVRKGLKVIVHQFSRPWWKQRRILHALTSSLGFRAEHVVRVRDGEIRRIETREQVLREPIER